MSSGKPIFPLQYISTVSQNGGTTNSQPFVSLNASSLNAPSSNVPSSNSNVYEHKARKYHMKIQQVLKTDYVNKGLSVPAGYEQYLQPF